jgi:radical SAM protein with 4Fe4S-binding SPASM domain
LTPERTAKVTQDIIAEGFKQIILVGGEPLLFKSLPTLLEVAHGKIDVALFTGGIPGDPARWLDICQRGVTRLVLSIDHGNEVLNDRIRGREGITDAAHKMAATFARHRPDLDISVSTVVSRYNIDSVDGLWERIRPYGPTVWALVLAGENFEASPDAHMARVRQLERFYRKTIPALQRRIEASGLDTELLIFPIPLPWFKQGIPKERWGDDPASLPSITHELELYAQGRYNASFVNQYGCPLAGSDITIGADGALLPCSQAPIIKPEFSIGSLVEDDLSTLLESEKMSSFRAHIPHAPCEKCWAPSNIEPSLMRQLLSGTAQF